MRHYFIKNNCVVSQLKHITLKTGSLGISKMWFTKFLPSKLTEIKGNFIKNKQNCRNV